MKANELMIGDWVYDTFLKCNTQVEILSLSGIRGDCNDNIWNEKTFLPIPLTAEILEKNGFEEKTESNPFVYYLFKDGDNSVSLEHTYDTTDKEDYWACSIGNRLCDVCTISMHYIHELQHALRLCGIDKEIVL